MLGVAQLPLRGLTVALFLAVALSACGRGGGGSVMRRPVVLLPQGHGLGAGEITVAAGVSEGHGNVVITCPAGGQACVVRVSAAGTAEYDRTGGVPTVTTAYASWSLARGHGLIAGEITVAAGVSEGHGNVVITCPADGRACVVRVSADGTADYEATGGIPTFVFTPPMVAPRTFETDNPLAEDLLDHWNQPEPFRAALGLSAVNAADVASRKHALAELITMARGDQDETGTVLRNVRPEDIEILGERDGITYGQWKGGAAGTLNIELDWRFAPTVGPATRAKMERAAKSWSRRLVADFGVHTIDAGTTVNIGRDLDGRPAPTGRFEEEVSTNGILIVMSHDTVDPLSGGGPRRVDATEDDYEPWLGSVILAQNNLDEERTIANYRLIHVMAHELGHAIGVADVTSVWNVPSVERYIDRQNHTHTGPAATRVNGGEPVPFQWLGPDGRNWVPPGTQGGTVDYGHLGACDSIVAYCTDQRETVEPTDLDFAYLADVGYKTLDADTASEPELYGYGAWGRYSAWGAGVERSFGYEHRGGDVFARDTLRASADAFGTAPGTSLAEANTPLQGGIIWSGSLIGVDLGQAMLPPVFGDAELRVELSTLEGAALFDDLTVHVGGVSSAFRASRLEYDIGVAGNSFSDRDGHVHGGFFGPAHEEMAGVLDDRTAAVNLLAGFGGTR